ncbi:alpha/beta fold hydrolase [Halobacteriaceae archaeon GCM10025711]
MARSDQFVTVDGTELHYSAWGDEDAPPVVCVHGLSRVGRDFDGLAARLEDEYRLVCPDMPGRGLSEWADFPEAEYSPEAMSALLVAFVDELDIDTMRWVGTSMGGMLGMGLAAGPCPTASPTSSPTTSAPPRPRTSRPARASTASSSTSRTRRRSTGSPAWRSTTGRPTRRSAR